MLFKQATIVFTPNGVEIGTVDRVIIDPRTKTVTHIIVQIGQVIGQERVVPVNLIDTTIENRVTLRSEASDLQTLPSFDATHYIPLSAEDIGDDYLSDLAHPLYEYPPLEWDTYTMLTTLNIVDNAIPLKEGARVISLDDKYVGNVQQVFKDPHSDHATHLVISPGLLLMESKIIPATWVTGIAEDEIRLAVGHRLLERLNPYQETTKTP